MGELTTNEILRKSIDNLGLSVKTKEILKKSNFNKISDIAKLDRQDLLSVLSALGIDYGELITCIDEVELKLNVNRLALGMNTLISDEERNYAISMPLVNYGISRTFAKKLEDEGIKNLDDISRHTVTEIRDISKSYERDIKNIAENLTEYGLTFKRIHHLNEHTEPLMEYVDTKKLGHDELAKFLARPISDLGLSIKATERLNRSGIYTIGDLAKLNNSELREVAVANKDISLWIKRRLEMFNISIETRDQEVYFSAPSIDIVDVRKMKKHEKELFMKTKLEKFGLSRRVCGLLEEQGILTIGDIDKLSAKEVRKAFREINYDTFKKALEMFKLFGIDKEEILPDRKYKEAELSPITFDSLSEEQKRELLSYSIEKLGLSQRIVIDMNKNGINTIGDLVGVTYSDVKRIVNSNPYALTRIKETLDEYGLKFKNLNTYFTQPKVKGFDVSASSDEVREKFYARSIEDLGVSGALVETLSEKYKAKTIGDLLKLTSDDIKNITGTSHSRIMKCLTERFDLFGIELTKVPENKEVKIQAVDAKTLSAEEKEKLFSAPISNFELSPYVVNKLAKIGIETFGELANTPKPYIRVKTKCNSDQMHAIEQLLAGFNIQMVGSSCFVKDGKVVSKIEDIKTMISERKVKAVDIRTLDGEEKEKVLDTRLEDLGLHLRALDLFKFKQNIETIRDVLPLYKSEFKSILAYNKDYIDRTTKVLSEFGIEFKDKPQVDIKAVMHRKQEITLEKEEKRKACKTQEDFMKLSLIDAGIPTKKAEKLEKLGYTTIGDITTVTKRSLIRKVDQDYTVIAQLKKALDACGLSFMPEVYVERSQKPELVAPRVIVEASEEDRTQLLATPIENIEFANKVRKILVNQGFETLQDVIETDPRDMCEILGDQRYLYEKFEEQLKLYGVNMPKFKDVTKAKREKVITSHGSNAPQSGSDNKYYVRQMDHYRKYMQYVKARDRKMLIGNIEDIVE